MLIKLYFALYKRAGHPTRFNILKAFRQTQLTQWWGGGAEPSPKVLMSRIVNVPVRNIPKIQDL